MIVVFAFLVSMMTMLFVGVSLLAQEAAVFVVIRVVLMDAIVGRWDHKSVTRRRHHLLLSLFALM